MKPVFPRYIITSKFALYELHKINIPDLEATYKEKSELLLLRTYICRTSEEISSNAYFDLEYFNDKNQIMDFVRMYKDRLK